MLSVLSPSDDDPPVTRRLGGRTVCPSAQRRRLCILPSLFPYVEVISVIIQQIEFFFGKIRNALFRLNCCVCRPENQELMDIFSGFVSSQKYCSSYVCVSNIFLCSFSCHVSFLFFFFSCLTRSLFLPSLALALFFGGGGLRLFSCFPNLLSFYNVVVRMVLLSTYLMW